MKMDLAKMSADLWLGVPFAGRSRQAPPVRPPAQILQRPYVVLANGSVGLPTVFAENVFWRREDAISKRAVCSAH